MSQSDRPTYTQQQVNKYLDHVGMKHCIEKEDCYKNVGLDYLNKLLLLQLSTIPFEDLDLHYSTEHTVSLDTEHLFYKIVDRKSGRGGYCMQNNLFFGTILRSLGYKVMPCGSRVSSAANGPQDPAEVRYGGWAHTVNMVYINGRKYFADVGFGANCPSIAIPVEDGWTGRRSYNNEFDDMLLKKTHILENTFTDEEQKLWVYHVRYGTDKPWLPLYCFSETEFLPHDFRAINFYVSRSLNSWFTYTVVVMKTILDENGRELGDRSLLGGVVKERRYGKSEVLFEAKSEKERIQALEKYFGIILNSSEKSGIVGYVTMLKG